MDWLDLLVVQGTLNSLQHRSSKSSILQCSAFFTFQLSHPYMSTGKTIALTRRTFVGKVMSLLFNMPSSLVITFLPRSKRLLISWLQSPSAVTLATLCEELTHWKRLWCWEGLGAGGKGDNRAWDGWMASLTWWIWVSVKSGSCWWTSRPGILQFMESQRVGYDWATELNWTELFSHRLQQVRICENNCIATVGNQVIFYFALLLYIH